MKFCKKFALITLIMACGMAIKCDNDENNPGLLLGPSMLTINLAPVANAGVDKNIILYAGNAGSADLDGLESYDPEGKAITYSWSVAYQPPGSIVSFADSTAAATSLAFNIEGTYEIMLTVNDGSASASDTLTVDVAVNTGPTANAGSDREATVGDTVTLDGSGSSDPDNDPLVYTWKQIYGPTIGTGTLTGVDPSITVPTEVCTIAYDLRVDDGSGYSFSDRVYIFVMKKGGAGIYVATTGDDAYDGTRARPLRTISAAIIAALAAGSDVYVSAGIYNESVILANGVSLFGGFDPSLWVRDSFKSSVTPSYTTTIQGGTIAVDGNSVKDAVIDGFTITSASAVATGEGSYGVRLINSTIDIKNCIITAGNGAAGDNGLDITTSPATANSGNPGSNGIGDIGWSGWDITDPTVGLVQGGTGGTSTIGRDGGKGGNGKLGGDGDNGENGLVGTPYGSGGAYGVVNIATLDAEDGSDGTKGSDGSPGSNGTGGSSGSITGNIWVSSSGNAGGTGLHGNGGGGGGGGGGQEVMLGEVPIANLWGSGGSGGGGGAGGAGGTGGYGGEGGGASIGIFLINTTAHINNCKIASSNGGNGGSGGAGGAGGNGGNGGNGGGDDNGEVGTGGTGGAGGKGGTGGYGGGGAGGPSYPIFKYGWSSGVYISDTTLIPGAGGAGGLSGGAPSGTAGARGNYGGA